MAPYIHSHKEYESPIHDYRVAAGLTLKELSAQSKVSITTIGSLANGMLAPIKEDGSGQLRKPAKILCEFFEVGPEELFPRYICSLNRSYKHEIQPYETWSERASNNFREQIENRDLARFLIKKGMLNATLREKRVLEAYLFNGETFYNIAAKEGISQNAITQTYKKSLKRIIAVAKEYGLPVKKELSWQERYGIGVE